MRIAFDGSGLTPPRRGVGNYIQQLLLPLLNQNSGDDYWVMAHRRAYVEGWVKGHSGVRRVPIHFPNRLVWMQFLLPAALARLRPDVTHFTNFVAPLASHGNLVVTVHDLYLLRFPESCPPRQRLLMRPLIEPSVNRARLILTVSEQSKRDIVQTLHVPSERVRVIYEAAAPVFLEAEDADEDARRRAAYGWDGTARNLLYVGALEPRKNVGRLVEALALLQQRGVRPHLWLVGEGGWGAETIVRSVERSGLEAFVHFTGFVPIHDLRAFSRGSDVFVFPSLYEGFGLPVLEAMAYGAVAAVSETPTLREIAGDAAAYFDPRSAESISDALARLLTDPDAPQALRSRAPARAELFSWEQTARETYAAYREVANHRE